MALIVMLVVLSLLLLYCCWGTCCKLFRRRRYPSGDAASMESVVSSRTYPNVVVLPDGVVYVDPSGSSERRQRSSSSTSSSAAKTNQRRVIQVTLPPSYETLVGCDNPPPSYSSLTLDQTGNQAQFSDNSAPVTCDVADSNVVNVVQVCELSPVQDHPHHGTGRVPRSRSLPASISAAANAAELLPMVNPRET